MKIEKTIKDKDLEIIESIFPSYDLAMNIISSDNKKKEITYQLLELVDIYKKIEPKQEEISKLEKYIQELNGCNYYEDIIYNDIHIEKKKKELKSKKQEYIDLKNESEKIQSFIISIEPEAAKILMFI